MKSIEELKELYESQLKPSLQSLESQRKKLMFKHIFYIVGIALSFLLGFLLNGRSQIIFFASVAGVITFIVLLVMLKKNKNLYRNEFKLKVVKEIVHLIDPDWNYQPDGRISESSYRASELFPSQYDRYKGDDLVTGIIEKTDFRFSELHTEYETESTDSEGDKKTEWHTIFKGIFGHADFNKEIQGKTIVVPDSAERLFGRFGNKLQKMSGRGKLIKLENTEFEKKFAVYGSDQIESRYVMTPAMMEAMLNIRNNFSKNAYFSFIGSRVYFAMGFNKDLFEPRIFKSGVRFEDMQQMNEQFRIIQIIVKELNLNTRIWTKN
jgi:hypothetical protein